MDVKNAPDVPVNDVSVEGATGVKIQWLVGHDDRPENFCMRMFELAPGGHTPLHAHAWEHEVFVVAGAGVVVGEEGEKRIGPHCVVHVRPGEQHQFRNTGADSMRFLCMVPRDADY